MRVPARPRSSRSLRLAGAALMACAATWATGGAAAAAPAGTGARPTIVHRVPFGLSIEYPLLERALGPGPCPSQALVATFLELGSPPLRIGGDSQDLAGPTSSYHYPVPPSLFTVLGCFAHETGAHITVGLNFGDGTVADAQAMVADARAAIPAAQLSFSLGNEPDLYRLVHPLWSEPGFIVPVMRGRSWSLTEFAGQWRRWRAMLGPIRLEGPDLATSRWAKGVRGVLRADPPDQLTAHFYPTVASGPTASATARRLLSRYTALEQINQLGWLLAAARATGRPAVISESNSASRGGRPGLSDTPVASIWAVRFILRALLVGYQQVFLHSAGVSYDPFIFNPDGTLTPHPLASALYFMHRWIPVGARLRQLGGSRDLFAVRVTTGSGASLILTSFARRPVYLPVAIAGSAGTVATDTLTTSSAVDMQSTLPVHAGRARLRLAPNTVVALSLG